MINVHRSYLALSVTWAGTGTERAPQKLDRNYSQHRSYSELLEPSWSEKASEQKSVKNLRKINDFCLLALVLGPSWAVLGLSGRVLGRPSGVLGRLGAVLGPSRAVLGRLGPVLGRLGAVLGPSWTVVGRLKPVVAPSWTRRGAILVNLEAVVGRFGALLETYEKPWNI